MSLSRSSALAVALLGCAAACHGPRPALPSPAPAAPAVISTAPARPAAPPRTLASAVATPPRETAEAPLSDDELFRRKSLDQLNAEHPLTDVFFELDQAVLGDTGREALDGDAHWLQRWTQTAIEIEGYCDERGTSEYNLALGERRARVARDYLENLGVAPNRITTVSFGKERGFCHESTEACWAQNRRGHFAIVAK
jgi:peptidoglycan-associated lipoprotein